MYKKSFLLLACLVCVNCQIAYANETNSEFEQAYTLAQRGDPDAEYYLAQSYFVRNDYSRAFQWMKKAANDNVTFAKNDLGIYYAHGIGVAKDLDKANFWLNKAAEAGDASAAFNLGLTYFYGRGVEVDQPLALKYFQESLAINPLHKGSLYMLAKYYFAENRNPEKADEMLKALTTSYYRGAALGSQEKQAYATTFYLYEKAILLHKKVVYPAGTTSEMLAKARENHNELAKMVSIKDATD